MRDLELLPLVRLLGAQLHAEFEDCMRASGRVIAQAELLDREEFDGGTVHALPALKSVEFVGALRSCR